MHTGHVIQARVQFVGSRVRQGNHAIQACVQFAGSRVRQGNHVIQACVQFAGSRVYKAGEPRDTGPCTVCGKPSI